MINSSLYAMRKRKRPIKQMKPSPPEEAKSNPSKRHRERLNAELERLADTLPFPEEVISRLDKLSILRLSVNYMRIKSFFAVSLPNPAGTPTMASVNNGHLDSITSSAQAPAAGQSPYVPEGDLLLKALNGFVMVITTDGLIFYASHTIQNYLGFLQSDVINQSVFQLIYKEDREDFRRQLHWSFNPFPDKPGPTGHSNLPTTLYEPSQFPLENSEFLDRSFVCRFRCLLNNTSGFLALQFHGKLKFLHGQNKKSELGVSPLTPLALFTIAVPVQLPSIIEIQERTLIFSTKHKLDFTPLSCDAKTRLVLGWSEAELQEHSGYQFIHHEDMIYCAEYHMKMIKTGESGMITFRILCRDGHYQWIQSVARIVYKNSKPDYIIANQQPLTEAEGELHLQRRIKQSGVFVWPKAASLYAASSVVVPQIHLSHSRGLDIKTEQGEFREECAPHSIEKKILDETTDISRLSEPLEVPQREKFSPVPCDRAVAQGVGRPIGVGSYGEAHMVTNTPDSTLGLDAIILEMLNDYGVSHEDLGVIPQNVQTKRVDFLSLNSDDAFLSDVLFELDDDIGDSITPTESLRSYPEDPWFLLESGEKLVGESCSSPNTGWVSSGTVSLDNKFCSPVWPQEIETNFCYPSPPVPNLSNAYLQNNSSGYSPNATYFITQSSMRLTRPVEINGQTYFHSPTLNLPSNKVTNTNPHQNLFNGQLNWLHQPGMVKPLWSLSGEDPQSSDQAIPTGFLPKGVMRFMAPNGAQSLLCTGPSWGSVQ